jgi:hypothetical protein
MEIVEAATVRAGEGELEREANVPSTEPQLSDADANSAVNVGVKRVGGSSFNVTQPKKKQSGANGIKEGGSVIHQPVPPGSSTPVVTARPSWLANLMPAKTATPAGSTQSGGDSAKETALLVVTSVAPAAPTPIAAPDDCVVINVSDDEENADLRSCVPMQASTPTTVALVSSSPAAPLSNAAPAQAPAQNGKANGKTGTKGTKGAPVASSSPSILSFFAKRN